MKSMIITAAVLVLVGAGCIAEGIDVPTDEEAGEVASLGFHGPELT